MFIYGVQPSQEIWEKKPEGLSTASAGAAWQAGFGDGAGNTTHAIFKGESSEGLQMFYDEGYERGEQEGRVVAAINSRHGNPPGGEEEQPDTSSAEEVGNGAAEIHVELDEHTLIRDSALVVCALSLLAIACSLWIGG